MHFVISGPWGLTDPTRAMLPFIFAALLMAVNGVRAKLVPVGPPNRYEEVASHPNVIIWAAALASMLAALPLVHL